LDEDSPPVWRGRVQFIAAFIIAADFIIDSVSIGSGRIAVIPTDRRRDDAKSLQQQSGTARLIQCPMQERETLSAFPTYRW
jgi:hypothetical protein